MKVQLSPRRLLELIKLGIKNGNLEATVGLIDDALAQIPDEAEFTKPPQPSAPGVPGKDFIGNLGDNCTFCGGVCHGHGDF
jgi:hypothetical protein